MALKKEITKTLEIGVTITVEGYHRITQISGGISGMNVRVNSYKDQASRENELSPIEEKQYSFIPNMESSDNFIKQGYEYLKTLEEYKYAVDC